MAESSKIKNRPCDLYNWQSNFIRRNIQMQINRAKQSGYRAYGRKLKQYVHVSVRSIKVDWRYLRESYQYHLDPWHRRESWCSFRYFVYPALGTQSRGTNCTTTAGCCPIVMLSHHHIINISRWSDQSKPRS